MDGHRLTLPDIDLRRRMRDATRRQRAAVAGGALVVCLVAWSSNALFRPEPAPRISRATFQRITLGMCDRDVDALVGLPPGDYVDGKAGDAADWLESQWDPRAWVERPAGRLPEVHSGGFAAFRSNRLDELDRRELHPRVRSRGWKSALGWLAVDSLDGKVVHKRAWLTAPPP